MAISKRNIQTDETQIEFYKIVPNTLGSVTQAGDRALSAQTYSAYKLDKEISITNENSAEKASFINGDFIW